MTEPLAKARGMLSMLWHEEPVLIAWAADGGLTPLLAFAFHLSPDQEAAAATIAGALATMFTVWRTRPAHLSAAAGALGTIATACGAFGLHLQGDVTGAIAPGFSAVMLFLQRAQVSPRSRAAAGSQDGAKHSL